MRQVLLQAEKAGLTPRRLGLITDGFEFGSRVDCIACNRPAVLTGRLLASWGRAAGPRRWGGNPGSPATGLRRWGGEAGQGVGYHGMKPRNGPAEQRWAGHAKITFYPNRCGGMRTSLSILRTVFRGSKQSQSGRVLLTVLAALSFALWARAQDDPLNKVHVPPPTTTTPGGSGTGAPAGAEGPVATGTAATRARPGAMIRMNVDMVLVPVTVTDPMNRLVTGLEKEDFQVYENNGQQNIRTFASEDAPVSIGIIFDLSGSMTSKLVRARESILQFVKTANPEDE